MGVPVIAHRAGHDGHVRLGLRVVVSRQRVLYPYVEPGAEDPPQAVGHEVHAERMAASLWCHGVQVSVDEFQLGVRLERAGFYGTVVLDPAQTVVADGDVGHCGSHDGRFYRSAETVTVWPRLDSSLPLCECSATVRWLPVRPGFRCPRGQDFLWRHTVRGAKGRRANAASATLPGSATTGRLQPRAPDWCAVVRPGTT